MLRNLKIVARLSLGFGILMILIAGLSGYAIYSSNAISTDFDRTARLLNNDTLVQLAEKQIALGRVHMWSAMATGDESRIAKAKASFAAAHETLVKLRATTIHPDRIRGVESLTRLLDDYAAEAAKSKVVTGKAPSLEMPETMASAPKAAAIGAKLDEAGIALSDDIQSNATAAESDAKARTHLAIRISLITGIASVLLGIALSMVVGRSVSRPVTAMTKAMQILAKGDTSVTIPATENTDEIGDMARTVQVFKDNAVQVALMRKDQEEAKARAEAERRKAMLDMADRFENSVMGLVKDVSSQASQMQESSQSMSAAAQQAQGQATTIAAAAEQATANVQTVASAAEELSSSIAEISRQVAEAATISRQASEETDRTNEMVQGLDQAAGRIGQVVSLITDIASQTNLLALNATMSWSIKQRQFA